MSITVHAADFVSERRLLIETLARHLTPMSDERRFDWLYTGSPHGRARAWLARNDERNEVIGVGAAFPRRVYVGDREAMAWVLGDFCLDFQYRSLGPALQLQRACLSVTESENAAFCYDFPNASMVAVYERMKITPTNKLLRLARPLRVDRMVRAAIPVPGVRNVVSAMGNTFLKLTQSRIGRDDSLVIASHDGRCGDEFSVLAKDLRGRFGVCAERSAEFLNWRYLDNPLDQYEVLTVRHDSRLQAYAVFTRSGEDGFLVDLFGVDDPVVIKGLVGGLAGLLEKQGVMTLSALIVQCHPWISWLTDVGFRVREVAPLVVVSSRSVCGGAPLQDQSWFFMQGDRDS
jgi:hypothetical protein